MRNHEIISAWISPLNMGPTLNPSLYCFWPFYRMFSNLNKSCFYVVRNGGCWSIKHEWSLLLLQKYLKVLTALSKSGAFWSIYMTQRVILKQKYSAQKRSVCLQGLEKNDTTFKTVVFSISVFSLFFAMCFWTIFNWLKHAQTWSFN